MAYRLTKAERETILRRSDDEASWTVMASSPPMVRRLTLLAQRLGLPVVRWVGTRRIALGMFPHPPRLKPDLRLSPHPA